MLPTPREMLDIPVAQLETLAAFLGEQLGEGSDGPRHGTTETRACIEILRSLRLQAARPEIAESQSIGQTDGCWRDRVES